MNAPQIDNYQFGNIFIDGQLHTKDVILLPDRVISSWWRQKGHVLQLADLKEVLAAPIQVLIVGQGAYSRMQISPEVIDAFHAHGIKLISLPTEQACQEYNRRSKTRKTAAALHLTC